MELRENLHCLRSINIILYANCTNYVVRLKNILYMFYKIAVKIYVFFTYN